MFLCSLYWPVAAPKNHLICGVKGLHHHTGEGWISKNTFQEKGSKPRKRLFQTPGPRRRRQADLCTFQASLVYIGSPRPVKVTEWDAVFKTKENKAEQKQNKTPSPQRCCPARKAFWFAQHHGLMAHPPRSAAGTSAWSAHSGSSGSPRSCPWPHLTGPPEFGKSSPDWPEDWKGEGGLQAASG